MSKGGDWDGLEVLGDGEDGFVYSTVKG